MKIIHGVSLSSLTIANRLRIGLGLIITFMVLLIVTAVWSLHLINANLNEIIKINNAKIELTYRLQYASATIDRSMTSVVSRQTVTVDEVTPSVPI